MSASELTGASGMPRQRGGSSLGFSGDALVSRSPSPPTVQPNSPGSGAVRVDVGGGSSTGGGFGKGAGSTSRGDEGLGYSLRGPTHAGTATGGSLKGRRGSVGSAGGYDSDGGGSRTAVARQRAREAREADPSLNARVQRQQENKIEAPCVSPNPLHSP